LKIKGFIWLEKVVEKILSKHNITPPEVEEAFLGEPKFKRGPKGHRHGERGYYCLRKSAAGRYIFVFFVLKQRDKALIISARDMTNSERKYYERK